MAAMQEMSNLERLCRSNYIIPLGHKRNSKDAKQGLNGEHYRDNVRC